MGLASGKRSDPLHEIKHALRAKHPRESRWKPFARSGSRSPLSWVFLLWAWVKAQRCAATLPVGETGVASARAAGSGGGSPARRGAHLARVCTRPDDKVVKDLRGRGRPGIPLQPAPVSVLYPCAREGGALSDRPESDKYGRRSYRSPSTSSSARRAMGTTKAPPPRRRGSSIPQDQSPLRRDQISM